MTHDEAERATQYLVDSSYPIGDARARMTKAEAMLRHIKALEMKACGENSVSGQEREAYASHRYVAAIDELFDATREYERLRAAREAARVRVDFFRTVEASQREARV